MILGTSSMQNPAPLGEGSQDKVLYKSLRMNISIFNFPFRVSLLVRLTRFLGEHDGREKVYPDSWFQLKLNGFKDILGSYSIILISYLLRIKLIDTFENLLLVIEREQN
uniref:Uncharacterized protein n=1 Tax=Candidozyma auris TaxID=498019 RepID=A0A0L0NZV0_CANAR